jgi:biopolymer transport protein ExbD
MPVKLDSKLPQDSAEARIEIIPLIDIMFFLLAAFMLVSLSMVNLKSVKVNLPTATAAPTEAKKNFVDLSVNKAGTIYMDLKPMAGNELVRALIAQKQSNPNLRVLVSGDRDARYGDAIRALDLVHAAGIDNVALEIKQTSGAQP